MGPSPVIVLRRHVGLGPGTAPVGREERGTDAGTEGDGGHYATGSSGCRPSADEADDNDYTDNGEFLDESDGAWLVHLVLL
jgi:hypothetical protein